MKTLFRYCPFLVLVITSLTGNVHGEPKDGAPAVAVSIDTKGAVVPRGGGTVRLLQLAMPEDKPGSVRYVDVSITLTATSDGKMQVEKIETQPAVRAGGSTLSSGTYTDDRDEYELKGPVFDEDQLPTWSLRGRGLEGLLIAGPIKTHPQLKKAAEMLEGLPKAGVWALLSNNAFSALPSGRAVLVNIRQVADTLVLTGYERRDNQFVESGVVVLRKKK